MSRVHDLAIALSFDGAQPSAFGAAPARAEALVAGGFVGEVARGGSCECRTLTLTPHCNGTHTESRRHLGGGGPAPFELLRELAMPARLVSVTPVRAADTAEGSDPAPHADDLVVTAAALAAALPAEPDPAGGALVVRTLPNDPGKRSADWSRRPAPFFTREAMQWIVACGYDHLLFDGPSLDRAQDGGRLTAHRVLWDARPDATVTEMIFVPDAAADGGYRLNLQVAPFDSDAAPSRPLLEALA